VVVATDFMKLRSRGKIEKTLILKELDSKTVPTSSVEAIKLNTPTEVEVNSQPVEKTSGPSKQETPQTSNEQSNHGHVERWACSSLCCWAMFQWLEAQPACQ
jgi:hypothetical protein